MTIRRSLTSCCTGSVSPGPMSCPVGVSRWWCIFYRCNIHEFIHIHRQFDTIDEERESWPVALGTQSSRGQVPLCHTCECHIHTQHNTHIYIHMHMHTDTCMSVPCTGVDQVSH